MTPKITELADHFMAGRYDQAAEGLAALRPDLSDEQMSIELATAAVKVLTDFYLRLRQAVEKAADVLDGALLDDPAPLAAYADARDVLRAALAVGSVETVETAK